MVMRDDLDRFYTPVNSADICINTLDLSKYDLIIEPSAGSGSFSSKISGCLAFDIEPAAKNIVKKDWFTITNNDLPDHNKMLLIGNPPFGKRSTLAKKFIRHGIELGATTIAFILPKTFHKRLNQTMFDSNWRLVKIVELNREETEFVLVNNEEVYVPCDFFVWTTDPSFLPGVDLRDVPAVKATTFVFVNRGDNTADFSINGNNGKIKEIKDITNPKAEHYIKVVDRTQVNKIKKQLESLNYNFKSSVNGGVAWVNREDIFNAYYQQITKQNIN